MITRISTVIFLAVTLCGCILQSNVPVYSEAQGEPLLERYGSRFATYSLDNGSWKKDEDTLTFSPKGHHYEATDGKSPIDVAFMNVSGDWWVMQGQEPGKPAGYMLIEALKGELVVHPIACKEMQEAGGYDGFAEFKGDDCFVKEGADAAAMFAKLAARPEPGSLKMVPIQ